MEEPPEGARYRPYIIPIQKIVLYETRNMFYLVGSNQTETKFRILKIDRTEPKELVMVEDQARYSAKDMKELLTTIASVNRPKYPSGLVRTVSAFGIVGFVQFLEGYYIILITKRRKVASIGYHSVYKIEDTAYIHIPSDGPSKNPEEVKYLKLFQSVDLSSNFYFTYSYDLTNSLQYNLIPPKTLIREHSGVSPQSVAGHGLMNIVNRKFMWNAFLVKKMEQALHPDWILTIVHGFVAQSNVCVFGRPFYLTLIARRSAHYAGTRFLKRGANFDGDVANEVETEQIIFDASISCFLKGRFTSFVQMRGSIPAHWSQDISKMVPKPPIGLDIPDPYAETPGKHFEDLMARFGSPIVVVNLVKKRERKRQESILSDEYVMAIKTLNQFLPPRHKICYIGFDMARCNKVKKQNVMERLASISEEAIKKTGFFQSHPSSKEGMDEVDDFGQLQTGIVRINCVDCLDRTNTAQFALGKCVLAHQLRALGVLSDDMDLEYETDIIRMLEEMYEDHGDTLALQYGGSQLVHRINTYRKTAPWTSQGNDIMQTLSRYYSNAFSDSDKQNAINLFLGIYRPSQESQSLWALENDLYLHMKSRLRFTNKFGCEIKPLTEWISDDVLSSLPRSLQEVEKPCVLLTCEELEDIDAYSEYYRPRQFIPMSELFAFKVSHSLRDFMPNFTVDYSPFSVRIRLGKRQEENIGKKSTKGSGLKNPSILGLSSTSSGTSTASSDTDEYSSSEDMTTSLASSNVTDSVSEKNGESDLLTFANVFSTMKESYGVEIKSPRKSDILLYKRFVHLQQIQTAEVKHVDSKAKTSPLIPLSMFSKDSSFQVTPPTVSRVSKDIYHNYLRKGVEGACKPGPRDIVAYTRYLAKSGNPSLKMYC